MTRSSSLLAALLLLGTLAACGSTPGQRTLPEGERLNPARLYPLVDGNVWSYNIDTGGGDPPTLAIMRVAHRGNRVEVSNNGTDPTLYEVRPEGIFKVSSQTWLLRSPIEVGAEWPSESGRVARVTSTSTSVETQAGNFTGCVVVSEAGEGRLIETTYCANVGMVKLVSQAELVVSTEGPQRITATLLGHALN